MDMLIFSILEPLTSVSLLMSIRIYSAPSAQSCFKVRPSVPIGFHSFHYLFATYLQESLTISAPSKSCLVTAIVQSLWAIHYPLYLKALPLLGLSMQAITLIEVEHIILKVDESLIGHKIRIFRVMFSANGNTIIL